MKTSAINQFLLQNDLRIAENPCVSPDFCLDWEGLWDDIRADETVVLYGKSRFATETGEWHLLENRQGDHAWRLTGSASEAPDLPLKGGRREGGAMYFPATYENLIALKNLAQEGDPNSSIFPTAEGALGESTLGIGARFTTLHWTGVDWAMANLGIGLTANQNSIPRELVYDVDAMLSDSLDTVPFPFIGTEVPEGHQGQSVEGMGHGCILAKLKTGFHARRIDWSFNADHQPIGGKFDAREDALVAGCLFASYITFDLSPELAITEVPEDERERAAYVEANIEQSLVSNVSQRMKKAGCSLDQRKLYQLLCYVWPAMFKMKQRDEKYRAAREAAFTTAVGRRYLRELSIDELPGLTTPETTAVMLALCEAMEMPVDFVAPAFGFQKNMPYPDNDRLRQLIERQWSVCEAFGVSIGFHSGSGKSAENYRVMGEATSGHLEIKTSGRYTYEMGVALSQSRDSGDQALWQDWYAFTRELALQGAFSENEDERKMAREFIVETLTHENLDTEVFNSERQCKEAMESLKPSPDHMFWFEYNFLFVLAANGKAEKSLLGDHGPEGYRQRARFYAISDEGKLAFARQVARYIVFLAENTGLVPCAVAEAANERLASYDSYEILVGDIAPA